MLKPKRVFIVGSSGAGKSTLATELGERWGLPVVHGDKLVWRAGWVMVTAEEMDKDVSKVLRRRAWILDSTLRQDWQRAIAAADLVIFLDYPN